MRKAELIVAGFEDARKHKREMWTASKSSVPLPADSQKGKGYLTTITAWN